MIKPEPPMTCGVQNKTTDTGVFLSVRVGITLGNPVLITKGELMMCCGEQEDRVTL